MIKHYTRLALIDTGRQADLDRYREQARCLAERWNLRFEEIRGSDALVRQMLYGPWDERFVVVSPGESIRYEQFYPGTAPQAAEPTTEASQ
jgi:hypothetical protein